MTGAVRGDGQPNWVGAFVGAVPERALRVPEEPGYRSPLLDLPGAVAGTDLDEGVAAHYGDPMGEQRILATGAGLVDRSNRRVVALTGPGRLGWSDSVTAQALDDLPGGRAAETLVLSPHGHVEHHVYVSNIGDSTWLNTEPGRTAPLLDHLETRLHPSRVDIHDVSEQWAVTTALGPRCSDALVEVGLTPPANAYDVASLAGGGWMRLIPYPAGGGVELVVPRRMLPHVAQRCREVGIAPVGMWAYEAMRVEALRPRVGYDTDERSLPNEVGWLGVAASVDRGYPYPGRQAVADAAERELPRRLVRLRLAQDVTEELPPHHTPLLLDDRQVGMVGTAVYHRVLGPIALALLDSAVSATCSLTAAGRRVLVDRPRAEPARA